MATKVKEPLSWQEQYRHVALAGVKVPLEVAVLATVSAGKSTLINALLGQPLLPAKSLACTERVFRITNRDLRCWQVGLAGTDGVTQWAPATAELLANCNRQDETATIELEGLLPGLSRFAGELVIYDTPGPNNSRTRAHGDATQGLLQSGRCSLVIHTLNATQLGTNDDARLLEELVELNLQPWFVLNKADQLDEEREPLIDVIAYAQDYLRTFGFTNPAIFPACASAALQARKLRLGVELTSRERDQFTIFSNQYGDQVHHWLNCSKLPPKVRQRLQQEIHAVESCAPEKSFAKDISDGSGLQLMAALQASGVRTLELMLEHALEQHVKVQRKKTQ